MRLLILKCSARKRADAGLLPAIERYNGPLWQVLRSYQREQPLFAADLTVYGLSAEYGLISGDTQIPSYERTMAPERADELRPQVLDGFAQLMGQGYDQLCLGFSDRYLRAMQGWEPMVPPGIAVTITDGPVGTKLGQLRAWLHGQVWAPQPRPERLVAPRGGGSVTIWGVRLSMRREEVLAQGRAALAAGTPGASHYRDWYVLLDDKPVAAKWLVSVISGLPVSQFDAANARRVLLALGVDVERRREG
jgi:hypothetical protein